MELSELLLRCREGDALAWEALVRQYQSRIFGIAYTYAGNREEARDLAQEIFVRVYERLDTCREAERFPAWIARIARNTSLDLLRRRRSRPPLHDVPAETAQQLRDPAPRPDEQWLSDERKRLVHRALQALSAISREIILLRDMQELPQAEIAAMLDIPVGTVKSRSNRARMELAQALLALGGPPAAESGA